MTTWMIEALILAAWFAASFLICWFGDRK